MSVLLQRLQLFDKIRDKFNKNGLLFEVFIKKTWKKGWITLESYFVTEESLFIQLVQILGTSLHMHKFPTYTLTTFVSLAKICSVSKILSQENYQEVIGTQQKLVSFGRQVFGMVDETAF